MQPKHWKRTWGIVFFLLILAMSTHLLYPHLSSPVVHTGILWLVQDSLFQYQIYDYIEFYEKNPQIQKNTTISFEWVLEEEIFIFWTWSTRNISWNINIDSHHDKTLKSTKHTLDINILWEENIEDTYKLAANMDLYINHDQNNTYIKINTRNIDQPIVDTNIKLLHQFIQLQLWTRIRRNQLDTIYSPGRRLTMLNNNMQRARVVSDLKITDGWYITSSGSGATLEANINPNSEQIQIEDKNNVFKVWLERKNKKDYELSILTAPDIKWRLDGNRSIDINDNNIKESSKWEINFPLWIKLLYTYESIASSSNHEFIPPSMYIDWDKLLSKIIK